jgi:hypothetical protein
MRKETPSKPRAEGTNLFFLFVVGLIAAGAMVVIGVVVILLFYNKGAARSAGPGGIMPLANNRITPENYAALKFGSTLAEVEAILGNGHAPTNDDFDAICGTKVEAYTNPFFKERENWQWASQKGQVYVWSNGQTRIMAFFHQPAEKDGRLVRRLLKRPDGSISSDGGSSTGANASATSSSPPKDFPFKQRPKTPDAPPPPLEKTRFTVAEILAEFHRDPTAATGRFDKKQLSVSGVIDELMSGVITMNSRDGKGKVQARLDGVALGSLGPKKTKVGDQIIVTGKFLGYFARTDMLMLDNCSFE